MSVPLVKFVPTCGSSSSLLARSPPYSPVACLSWKSGHFLFPLLFLITHTSLSSYDDACGCYPLSSLVWTFFMVSTLTGLWCQTPCVDFDSVAATAQLSMWVIGSDGRGSNGCLLLLQLLKWPPGVFSLLLVLNLAWGWMDFAVKCPHVVAGCHRNLVTLRECKILSCHLYKATKGWIGWPAVCGCACRYSLNQWWHSIMALSPADIQSLFLLMHSRVNGQWPQLRSPQCYVPPFLHTWLGTTVSEPRSWRSGAGLAFQEYNWMLLFLPVFARLGLLLVSSVSSVVSWLLAHVVWSLSETWRWVATTFHFLKLLKIVISLPR